MVQYTQGPQVITKKIEPEAKNTEMSCLGISNEPQSNYRFQPSIQMPNKF